MATSYRNRFHALLRDNEDRMAALYVETAADIARLVYRAADAEGNIPLVRWQALRREVGLRIVLLFLARTPEGDLAGFTDANGRVTPQSAYAVALWMMLLAMTRLATEQQANLMRRRIDDATRVRMQRANGSPDLSDYQPPHLRVGPDGMTLADRLWRTAGETRRKTDQLLNELLAERRSAAEIADTLTRFLTPGQTLPRKGRYGTTGTFDGLRLARTEGVAQFAQAGMAGARLSPVITGFGVRVGPRHTCCDGCDDIANGSPHPLNAVQYMPPFHANCACMMYYIFGRRSVDLDVVNPTQVARFTDLLLTSRT